jgi:hypothetical protein
MNGVGPLAPTWLFQFDRVRVWLENLARIALEFEEQNEAMWS